MASAVHAGRASLTSASPGSRLRSGRCPTCRVDKPKRWPCRSPILFALPIPEGMSDEEAVLLTDILPTGYLGALRADIRPGATVVVVGLGPVGIMALRCAALFGPARILAVDMVPERLARAERLGAEPIDARVASGSAQVLEATGGRGAESVIEAVGADATITEALACAATGGTVSMVGVNLSPAMTFPMGMVFLKSLTVRTIFAPVPGTWPATRAARPVGSLQRPRRHLHAPHRAEPGARRLRVVRLARGRGLEGLALAERLRTPRAPRACG